MFFQLPNIDPVEDLGLPRGQYTCTLAVGPEGICATVQGGNFDPVHILDTFAEEVVIPWSDLVAYPTNPKAVILDRLVDVARNTGRSAVYQ